MKIVAITQARVGSSRLPAKVLKTIGETTVLELHLERASKASLVNQLIVATTTEPDVEKIKAIAAKTSVGISQGSVNDVLDRFYQAVKDQGADYVVRITSDCPLIDPELMDKVIAFALEKDVDYVSNTLALSFPDGQDIEVIKYAALEKAWKEATLSSEREHVTPYIWKNSTFYDQQLFSSANYGSFTDYSKARLTIDEPCDFETISLLVQQFGTAATWEEYAAYYLNHLQYMPNYKVLRNVGYTNSLLED